MYLSCCSLADFQTCYEEQIQRCVLFIMDVQCFQKTSRDAWTVLWVQETLTPYVHYALAEKVQKQGGLELCSACIHGKDFAHLYFEWNSFLVIFHKSLCLSTVWCASQYKLHPHVARWRAQWSVYFYWPMQSLPCNAVYSSTSSCFCPFLPVFS